jgi:hypothetical protein
VQEVVASIILGPGQWEGWYAKWNEQYAQWAPDDLGQLTWPFRCLMDRDDMTGRLAEITCPTLIVHGTADAAIPPARAEAARDGLGGRVTAEDRVFHPASCRRDIEPLAVPVESVRAQVRAPVTADPSHDDITPLSQERLDLLHRCHPCTLSEPLA